MDLGSPVYSSSEYGVINAEGNAHLVLGNAYQQPVALTKEQKCCQSFKTCYYEDYKDRNPSRVDDPGCGKSILSKALVDDGLCGDDQSTLCYFFFEDNEEQDNLATALSAILHQLFSYKPYLLRHAMPAWANNGNKLRAETREMWRIFQAIAMDGDAGPTVCVMDALDECRDADQQMLIGLLCDLQLHTDKDLSPSILKVLVTSRPCDNVQRWFAQATLQWPQIRLRGEDENDQIRQEINIVIEQRVRDLASKFDLPPHISDRIQRQLLNMQHRTYLWLHLAMKEVRDICRNCIYPDDLNVVSLPTSVEEAYEHILRKIEKRQTPFARQILLIVVGARRPLNIQEMALALSAARASERNASSLIYIEPARLRQQNSKPCGLFVFIDHSQLFLIHQTAKEFFSCECPKFQSEPFPVEVLSSGQPD